MQVVLRNGGKTVVVVVPESMWLKMKFPAILAKKNKFREIHGHSCAHVGRFGNKVRDREIAEF